MLIPATVQVIHAFENHDHEIVHSLNDLDHVQSSEEECTLCDLILDSVGFIQKASYDILLKIDTAEQVYIYSAHKEQQFLSYPLRGPPTF